MLSQYGPDLLVMCKNSIRLSEQVVRNWLGKYMFAQETGGRRKAARIAKWLASHTTFKSHGRHLSRDELERKGLNIVHLEKDQGAQDVFLSVFHATAHTFNATDSVKIIENHNGKAFIKRAGVQLVPVPAPRAPIP